MKICGVCGRTFDSEFKFCPNCGASEKKAIAPQKRDGKFSNMAMVYGPPYKVVHHCKKCEKDYLESGLGSPHGKYCPHCGKKYEVEDTKKQPEKEPDGLDLDALFSDVLKDNKK